MNTNNQNNKDNKIKFTEEELIEAKFIKQKYNDLFIRNGQLGFDRFKIEELTNQIKQSEDSIKEEFKSLIKIENAFADKIAKKYGEGSLDTNTGVYKIINENS